AVRCCPPDPMTFNCWMSWWQALQAWSQRTKASSMPSARPCWPSGMGSSWSQPRVKGWSRPIVPPVLKVCARLRKGIETVGSHLTERFALARIRVHDLWHFQHRLIRKVLAPTVSVFLNLQLGRPSLDLDGLVTT